MHYVRRLHSGPIDECDSAIFTFGTAARNRIFHPVAFAPETQIDLRDPLRPVCRRFLPMRPRCRHQHPAVPLLGHGCDPIYRPANDGCCRMPHGFAPHPSDHCPVDIHLDCLVPHLRRSTRDRPHCLGAVHLVLPLCDLASQRNGGLRRLHDGDSVRRVRRHTPSGGPRQRPRRALHEP